jgi:integrase
LSKPKPRQVGGSIRKTDTRSGPRWRFTIDLDPDPSTGRRRQRTFTFRTEAEAVAAQAATRVQVARHTFVDRHATTLDDWLDQWLAAGHRHWRPSTWRSYVLAVKPFRERLGPRRLQRIGKADIEAVVAAMLATGGPQRTGRSPRTVALALQIVGKAFRDAIAEDLLQRDPTAHVRRPVQAHREMATWDAAQAAAFIDQVHDHPLTGPLNLTMRGLRRGEVLGLQWGDIDLARGVLHIRRTRTDAGTAGVVVGPPKTARSIRTLPLDPPLVDALRRTRSATVRSLTEPWVAVDGAGRPLRPDAYGDLFTGQARAAGLPRIRLHDARHTALSLLLGSGVPVHVVARFAGHDPSVTLRTYAHADTDALNAASGVFGAAFGQR